MMLTSTRIKDLSIDSLELLIRILKAEKGQFLYDVDEKIAPHIWQILKGEEMPGLKRVAESQLDLPHDSARLLEIL